MSSDKRPRSGGGAAASKPPSAPRPAAAAAAAAATADSESSGTESDELTFAPARDRKRGAGDDDEEEDDDGSDSSSNASDVHVTFDFFDPEPIDFKSVRLLLDGYLPGLEGTWDVSGLAEAIIAQEVVGTMVKIEDDLDVYAFATVLPLAPHMVRRELRKSKRLALHCRTEFLCTKRFQV